MDPSTLETLQMLRKNKDLCDEVAIQRIMLKGKTDRAKEKAQREAAERHDSYVDLTEENNLYSYRNIELCVRIELLNSILNQFRN